MNLSFTKSFYLVTVFLFSSLIHAGNGSESSPYTVNNILGMISPSGNAHVQGYIVSYADAYGAPKLPANEDTNILLADNPEETDGSKMICVQLKEDAHRNLFGLKSNPSNVGMEVLIEGTLTDKYNNLKGIKPAISITEIKPSTPAVRTEKSISFGNKTPGETAEKTIRVTGYNLTGNLKLELTGDNDVFKLGTESINKADAENGFNLTVTFSADENKDYQTNLIISEGGLVTPLTIPLSGKGITLFGNGKQENPFITRDIIALNNTLNDDTYWVAGYIVGVPVFDQEPEFAPPFSRKTALYLAESPDERNTKKMVSVQLPTSGNYAYIGEALNLQDNAYYLGLYLSVLGELAPYFDGDPGVKKLISYDFPEPPVGINQESLENENKVWIADNTLYVSSNSKELVTIYDLAGKIIFTTQINNEIKTVNTSLSEGIFIIKIGSKVFKLASSN